MITKPIPKHDIFMFRISSHLLSLKNKFQVPAKEEMRQLIGKITNGSF